MNRLTVYIIMVDHELELYQHSLGVYTSLEKAAKVQQISTIPTSIYETLFHYDDEYPEEGNLVIVETTLINGKTAALRATNMYDVRYDHSQTTCIDPDEQFVNEYLRCINNSSNGLEAFLADTTGMLDFFGTDEITETVQDEPFDIGEENLEFLRQVLA